MTKNISFALAFIGIIEVVIALIVFAKPSQHPVQGSLIEDVENADVVMWIGAHPDDQLFVTGLLAKVSLDYGKETYVVSLTDIEKHRQNNKECVALLNLKDYIRFDGRQICEDLTKEECKLRGIEEMKELLINKKPSLIITFEPTNGFRGHPHHMITSRVVYEALIESGIDADFYYVINRDESLAKLLNGPMDPLPYTDTLDLDEYSEKTDKSLWETKLELMEIYSDSVPNAQRIIENKEIQKELLHKEFYRKVE